MISERSSSTRLHTLPRHITQSSAPGNLIQFPLPIRDGWAIVDLTTSQERLSRLKDEFETAEIIYNIEIITQSTDVTDLLTDRQREFSLKAVERGYYERPRQCTLNWIRDDLFTGYLA